MSALGVEWAAKYELGAPAPNNEVRTNLLLDPRFNYAATLWTANFGLAGEWEPTSLGTVEGRGKLTGKKANTAIAKEMLVYGDTPVGSITPGLQYLGALEAEVVDAGSIGVGVYIDWLTAAGAYISSGGASAIQPGTGIKNLTTGAATAPATASRARFIFRIQSAVALDTVEVLLDDAIFQKYVPGQTAYFDGTYSNAKWTGETDKSTSTTPLLVRAVFNDDTDPDFVGILSPESSGLDSPDIREDAADIVEGDGGIHGDFYTGRRPVILQGTILANSPSQRNERVERLQRASLALRSDATLQWQTVSAVEPVSLTCRRQQPLRITKGYVKDFQLPLVAADPRMYGGVKVMSKSYTSPAEGLSSLKVPGTVTSSTLGGGTVVWTNPENAKAATGGGAGLATLPVMSGVLDSRALLSSNHGFALPEESTVVGIECQANIWLAVGEGVGNGPGWGVVQLVKAGAMVGENKGLGVLTHSWPSSNFTYTWGGSTDLWGTTWTAAQINATNFGLALIARHYAAQAPTKEGSGVDWMTVKVFYKVGTELHSQTVTTNGTVSTAPVIYVYGPVPSTGIEIKNLTTGYTFKSETKPTAGQFLALDFAKTSAILSTGADKYGDVVFDPNSWWRLVPGTNELLLPASAKVELAWRDAWM